MERGMNVAMANPRQYDCQQEGRVTDPEHQVAMAMQSLRSTIGCLSAMLNSPAHRPHLRGDSCDIDGAALALAVMSRNLRK